MTIANNEIPRARGGLTGPKVLAWCVGFFVSVGAVNVYMVTTALESQPGLVADHPYERGLAHNDVLAAEAKEQGLGWKLGSKAADGVLTVTLQDAAGLPVSAERIDVRLLRPSDAHLDRQLDLVADGAGQWRAAIDGAAAGLWHLAVVAERGGQRYDSYETLVLP
ncbi:FixH family protein [Zavarzinia sp.]|uniref:FixH family protein n=1 Tax=Zavarzinia sp. TaxID=2027920 RepID=UPI003564D430